MLKVQVLLICIQSQKELAAWQNHAFEPLFERQVYRLSLEPLFIQLDYSFCSISSWVHYILASWHRHKLRRSDLSRECFKDSEHYLTYQVQSVGTLEKENMILLSESTKKQSQLFFLLMYVNFLIYFIWSVIQQGQWGIQLFGNWALMEETYLTYQDT